MDIDLEHMIAAVIEECVRPVDGTQGRKYREIHQKTPPEDKATSEKVE